MQGLDALAANPFFWPLVLWSLIWKGLALWRAGNLGDKLWFVIIFIINTAGILEIFYIFVWSKRKSGETIK